MTIDYQHNTYADLLSELVQSKYGASLGNQFPTLRDLGAASIDELASVPGIGISKARAVRAAYTLAIRLKHETYSRTTLNSPQSVAELLREKAAIATQEQAYLVMLDSRNRMIRLDNIGTGTLDSVLIHAREVYAPAIQARSSSIILAHTHPSGDSTPSESDIRVSVMLKRSGGLLGVPLLDHVIVGRSSSPSEPFYSSMKELGYLD